MSDLQSFHTIISPLSEVDFLAHIWGHHFCHRSGSSDRFKSLISWQELNTLLENGFIQHPRMMLYHRGKRVDTRRFIETDAGRVRLKSAGLARCLSEGATLIVNFIDEICPPIRRVAESFSSTLGAHTHVNLYAGWRADNGFDLHWDTQDTMIIQVDGRKHWKVFAPTRLHPFKNKNDDFEPAPLPTSQPVWDGLLESGDMIYLPRGWWHLATPIDEPSLHLTITCVPPCGVDFIRWLAERLKEFRCIRQNIPHEMSSVRREEYMSEVARTVTEACTDARLGEFLEYWRSTLAPEPCVDLPHGPTSQSLTVELGSVIRLAMNRSLSFRYAGDSAYCRADGLDWQMSKQIAEALKLINSDSGIAFDELTRNLRDPLDKERIISLVQEWAIAGVVWVTR